MLNCFRIGKFSEIQTKSLVAIISKNMNLSFGQAFISPTKRLYVHEIVNWTSLYWQSLLWNSCYYVSFYWKSLLTAFAENLYWQPLLAQSLLTQFLLRVFTNSVNLRVNYDIYKWKKQSQAKQRMDKIKYIIMQHLCCEAMIYSGSSNPSTSTGDTQWQFVVTTVAQQQ